MNTEMLNALNFDLSADGSLPTRIVLLPAGATVVGRDGRSWKNPNPQGIVAALNAKKLDLVLDFEHSTEIKGPKGEAAPAAAWLNDFAINAEGAVTAAIKYWTPKGEEMVRNREYRYLSPVIRYSKLTGEIAGISSVALVNQPNFFIPALNSQQKKETPMKGLLKLLGLTEDATEETAINAVKKMQGDLQTAMNREITPDLTKFVPRADYDQTLSRATNAEQKLADDAKEKLETAINSEIDAALKAGKIAPASKDFYAAMCRSDDGLTQFKTFLESAPTIVAASELDKQDLPEGKALNAEEKQLAAIFGNTEEDLKKYGQA